MKRLLVLSVACAAIFATSASAAPVITLGQTASVSSRIVQDFEGFATGASIGSKAFAFSGSDGRGAKPAQSTGNYGSVLGGGTYAIDLAPTSAFSFLLGTLDGYNGLTLSFADSTAISYNGAEITNGLGSDGYVTYLTGNGPKITGATFTSGGNSFEFDNISSGVPEPATWAMMIMGFGLVGAAMRRRSIPAAFA